MMMLLSYEHLFYSVIYCYDSCCVLRVYLLYLVFKLTLPALSLCAQLIFVNSVSIFGFKVLSPMTVLRSVFFHCASNFQVVGYELLCQPVCIFCKNSQLQKICFIWKLLFDYRALQWLVFFMHSVDGRAELGASFFVYDSFSLNVYFIKDVC